MEKMVEPDRTIMIVSIIGLVVIWGSVLYHKFVQGGRSIDSTVVDPLENQPQDQASQISTTETGSKTQAVKNKKKKNKSR